MRFTIDSANPHVEAVKARLWAALREQFAMGARTVVIQEPKRTDEQNALMWVLLHDIAAQVGWRKARWRGDRLVEEGRYVNFTDDPRASALAPEQFKNVLTAAIYRPDFLPGIDGGVVAVGLPTSRMTRRQLSELIELIYAFGAEHGVGWSEPKAA
jgi:hypothetical protein